MKKYPEIKLVPDEMREELDLLGYIYCPAKEAFSSKIQKFVELEEAKDGNKIKAVVPMGACGKDEYFNVNKIKDIKKFPSVVTSSGFSEFFDKDFMERFLESGDFEKVNFKGDLNQTYKDCALSDPKGFYNIFSSFPYVFLVDTRKLNNRPIPSSWEEILDEQYENSIAMGHTEEDINEIVLLYMYKNFGEEGIKALARNVNTPMGNIEMAKTAAENQRSNNAIYIIPYFFAKATPKKNYLQIIWPKEGGLLCPVFMLIKKERKNYLNKLIDYIYSEDLGQELAKKYFPHINCKVDNRIPDNGKLQWLSWDFIYEKNIITRIKEIEEIFYNEWEYEGRSCIEKI
ncbi:ABC transporter substrate-binding protein [Clostridium sp. YIM B02555]|uniref:ABC transporter substrate-binding protein n=1 Tax=Clostridium sp. YIM B02555 TaxID=2911968 RepID=UPI001EEF5CCF|nr:ABC transporter substrate-binding protein [Clostridium sp. YIM B02555]